jgi:hypothetical protein
VSETQTIARLKDWIAAADNLLVNCAEIGKGKDVLFVNERGKGVDPEIVAFLEERARQHGAAVRSLWPARAESPEAIPADVMAAIEGAEITIFNHQIGPLLRLRPAKGRGVRVLNYAATKPVLESEFARIPHGLWVEAMALLTARLARAKSWRVTCPLGTDIGGAMPETRQATGDPATGFSLRSFPMDTHQPVPSPRASGRIALRWLVTSATHDLGTEGITLESPVLATVEEGVITKWEGDAQAVEHAKSFLAELGRRYGKEPFIVNSWHAGTNPQACVAFGPEQSLEQWMLLAHGNPRVLHFHLVGKQIPGEISATVLDATVRYDGEALWEKGRLRVFEGAEYRALAERWPGGARAFVANDEIGA